MPFKSHYDVLQVDSRATNDEIKRAFRRLSMELHPDKNGNSEESKRAFQEINEAYNVVGDPEKRGNYDFELQMGIGGHRMGPMGMGPMGMGMGPMGMGMGPMNPLDMLFAAMHSQHNAQNANPMFEAMFGMGGPRIIIHNFTQNMNDASGPESGSGFGATPDPGSDINVIMSLPLTEAYNGSQHPLLIQYEDESHEIQSENIAIHIPPRIPNGCTMSIPDKGNVIPNSGGRRGALHLEISIEEHPTFRRDGDDLVVEHRVSLKDALCGFAFDLVHLNGRNYKFNCKPCSITASMNETKILPGLGYNESGALKIRFSIELPTSLTEEQIAALSTIL